MRKTIMPLIFFLSLALTACSQPKISDKQIINITQINPDFDIGHYFEDKDVAKPYEHDYAVKRKHKMIISKNPKKDIASYHVVFHSVNDTLANLGAIYFDNVAGYTDKSGNFYGLVFKSTTALDDDLFKKSIAAIEQKFGKPNFTFRDPMWDAVSKKLYSWKTKDLIYVAYLDNQEWLRVHIINFKKLAEIKGTEIGWELVDL